MELEAEIVHLTEERNRERSKVKAGAKIAGLFKAITNEMEQRVKPFVALPPALDFRRKAVINEHCVMHLSDGHHDQVVRPEEVGGLEDYNFPVSCAAPNAMWIPWSSGPRIPWRRNFTFRCSGFWPMATTLAARYTGLVSGPTTAINSRTALPSASFTR